MSTGANVGSIDAVRHLRAVMHTFSQEAREALSSYDTEVHRTLDWLLNEMPQRWKAELRKCDEDLQQARIDLERCRNTPLPGGGTPSCMEQKKAFEKAKARRQYVEDKLDATRRWGATAEREASEYTGRSNQLASVFDAELPKAILTLDRVLTSLEAYQSLRVQSSDMPLGGATSTEGTAASVAQPIPAAAAAQSVVESPAKPAVSEATAVDPAHTKENGGASAAPGSNQP